MGKTDKKNAGLMNLIKRMHGVVENVDIEKHRQSQDHFGALLGNSRDVIVENVEIAAPWGGGRCDSRRVDYCKPRAYEEIYHSVLSRRRLFHGQQPVCQNIDDKAGVLHFHGCTQL